MVLSSSLSAWAWILQKEKPLTIRQRVFGLVTATRGSQLVVVANVILLLLGTTQGSSLTHASGTISFCTGLYGCFAAQTVFRLRGERLQELVSDTASIAKAIELDSTEESQACLVRAKRADTLLTAQYMVMGGFLILSIYASVIYTGAYYGSVWPKPPGVWGDWTICLMQLASTTVGSSSYYLMCSLLGSLGIWVGGMYRALAAEFRAARSKSEVLRLIRHHQNLNEHARAIEFFLTDVLMHLFVCCFSCPFTSTVDVLLGEVTMITFSAAPLITSVFLPFSVISQELMDSSMSIGSAAFESVFESDQRKPQDDLFVRRALLLTIASARRPAQLSCRGLGSLSLNAAGNALRTWYSLVNMVISSGRKGRGL